MRTAFAPAIPSKRAPKRFHGWVVLDKERLNVIKDSNFPLHDNLVAVVVDECHTVET
jgi:hypothetical protein